MSINAGATGPISVLNTLILDWHPTTPASNDIKRTGKIQGTISSGNVLIGTGASSGLSIGNITVGKNTATSGPVAALITDLTLATNGVSNVTLDGSVDYTVDGTANLGVWANAGGAFAIGGSSTSTVTGSSTLTLKLPRLQIGGFCYR